MNQGIVWAFMGTGFTFLMTAFGASVVFILKNDMGKNLQRAFLGFAAGVMIAASVWSCLLYTSPSPRDGLLSRMPSSA